MTVAVHLYVYYAVAPDDVPTVIERVRAMHAMLASDPCHASVVARLLRRAEEPAQGRDAQTWMEVYEDVSPDFEARLAAAVDACRLGARTGARHVERFTDIA